MGKIAIVTDSNSGITQAQGKELGIHVIPMPFYINEELFYEDITLTQEQFYQKLAENAEISTSQPSPADVIELWEKLLEDYDEIIHIPMSSALSSTCETAIMLAKDFGGKVHVIDNQRISITMRQSVLDAIEMVEMGLGAEQIEEVLMKEKLEGAIYITVDTLKYLKKGGRVTPAAAALGTVLNLKPVLQIQGGKLDSYAKVRGMKAAKKTMIEAMKNELDGRFAGKQMHMQIAHTCEEDVAAKWKEELEAAFPEYDIHVDRLSLSVSCHIGPGALAVACCKKFEL